MALTEHPLFRLLETPAEDAAMGGCYVYHDTGPCIDTGVNIYMEGNLTLGLQALREMCEVAGFRFNAEGTELERQVAEQQHTISERDTRIAELEELLEQDALLLARASRAAVAEPDKKQAGKPPVKHTVSK